MKRDVEKIIVDLITYQLDLPNDYGLDKQGNTIPCVMIANQNIKLFNTDKLQITVKTLSNNIFSNRNEVKWEVINNVENFYEHIYTNEQRTIQIDIYSRDNSARERFNEVQACLNSTYAQQLQDRYQFRIGTISQAINISGLDGGSDINRYTIRFNCLVWNENIKAIDYYDKFHTTVETEKGLVADFKTQVQQ